MRQSNDPFHRRSRRRSVGVVLAVAVAIALVAAGVSGTVAAESHDDKLDSGTDFFVGQSLSVDMTETDTTYNIYEVDENDEAASRVLAFETNGTGEAVVDTEDLDDSSEYVIGTNRSNIVTVEDGVGRDDGNSSATGKTFRFTQQGLSVEFGDDTVEQGDTDDVTVDSALRLDSEYDVEITSDDLSADDLVGVFGGTETDDGTVVAADSLTAADVADVDPGEYTFTFDVTDTAASDTASITVAENSHDAKLDSGYDFYVGQSLSVDMTESDTTYNIYEVDENDEAASRVLAFETNGTGEAVVDTEDIDDSSEYVIGTNRSNIVTVEDGVGQDDGNSSATGKTFRFDQQGLSVEFDDDTVEDGGTTDVTVDSALRFDSEYDVEVTSDDLSTDDLVGVFGGTETDDGTVVAADSLTTADVTDVDPGEYTFTFDVTDTTASDTASITVEEESDVDVTLPEMANVDRGDVASIPVELEGTDTAYVAIGNEDDDGFRVIAEVTDGNDDGTVTLEANTDNLLDHDAAVDEKFWTADGDDSVENVWYDGPDSDDPLFVSDSGTWSYDLRVSSDFDTSSHRLSGDADRSVLRVFESQVDLMNSPVVDRGDVASIPIELTETDSGYVTIGHVSDDGFRTIVKVRDGNDDGEVTLKANTFNLLDTSNDNRYWTEDDEDSVTFVGQNGTTYDDPLPVSGNDARSYDIRAGNGWNSSDRGSLTGGTDNAELIVTERSTEDLSMWTASTSATLDSVSAIESSRPEREAKDGQAIENSTAIVAIEATGLSGAIRAADGSTPADRFASLVENDVIAFGPERVDVTNPVDDRIDLRSDATHVVPDPDNGTVFVVMDPEARSLSGDSVFEFSVPEDSPLGTGDAQTTVQTDRFSVSDRTRLEAGAGSLDVENETVASGDVATIPIDVGDNDRVSVRLGSEYADWERVVRVEDSDGDGQVTLRVNTFTAAAETLESSGIEAIGADEVLRIQNQHGTFDGALGAGSDKPYGYTVAVYDQYDSTADSVADEYGVGRLIVEPRSTTGMEVWTAPDDATIETVDDVSNAISEDTLSQSQTIAEGDYAVAELEATGIFGALEAQPGSSNAEKLASLDENVSSLNVSIVEPAESLLGGDSEMDLSANTDALTVITNQDDGQLFVLMDTDALGLEYGDQRVPTFTVNGGESLANGPEDQTVEQAFEMEAATLQFDQKLDSGMDFIIGQSLSVDMTETDTTYNIYEVDDNDEAASRVLAFETNGTGEAVVDTEDLDDSSEYVIGTARNSLVTVEDGVGQDDGNSSATGKTFRFDQQGLSVEFDDDTVEDGGTTDVTVNSALRANSEYDVEVTSDDLSADDLVGVFGGTETDDGTVVAADSLTSANFSNVDLDAGEYTFTFDVTDTTAADEASISVQVGPSWPANATDPDDDGLYEDLSGDGAVNFPDVNRYFQHTDSEDMARNLAFYDYTGDGEITLQDVMTLFQMI